MPEMLQQDAPIRQGLWGLAIVERDQLYVVLATMNHQRWKVSPAISLQSSAECPPCSIRNDVRQLQAWLCVGGSPKILH